VIKNARKHFGQMFDTMRAGGMSQDVAAAYDVVRPKLTSQAAAPSASLHQRVADAGTETTAEMPH
jgi:hypothetical protein